MTAKLEDYVGKVTVTDGAWGTELDKLGCPPGFCREEWNISQPDYVEQVASAYVAAGSRIILTNTFGGNRFVLARHERADKVAEFNIAGAQISKRAAGAKARVFGSIGPSGSMIITGEVTEDELFAGFKAQAEALAEGGVDALVVETMADLTEGCAAVRAAKTTGLMVVACMTYDSGKDQTRTMMGVTPEQAAAAFDEAGADVVGCNCGVGIENYVRVTAMYRQVTTKPIWVKANAGMPVVKDGQAVYNMQPETFAQQVKELVAAGANFVGGCCGTSPEFIAAMARMSY